MATVDSRFEGIFRLLSRFTLKELPWRIARDKLVTLSLNTTVNDALEILSSNNILSAPCFDSDKGVYGQFCGFVDMQQLTRYVTRLVTGNTSPDGLFWDKARLRTTTIRDLIRGTQTAPILGEYSVPISETSSLFQAFERMARNGQHRLAVTDWRGVVVGVVCQSELLSFLAAHLDTLDAGKNVTVAAVRPYTFVNTINEHTTAIRAFEQMDKLLTSLNGIAVVDDNGRITDVISTHDLRGILPRSADFNMLWSSVSDFKDSVRRRFSGIKYLPKTCKRTDTLESVIRTMASAKVHRVFVVDANSKPVDVVTQTDVMRYFLFSMTGEPR